LRLELPRNGGLSRIFSSSLRITPFAASDAGTECGCGAGTSGTLTGLAIMLPGLRWEL
jgi:hypothetical protein